MIDPKMLELSVYDGIPHLLSPVVTDPKKAVVALKWVGRRDGGALPQDVEDGRAQHRRLQRPREGRARHAARPSPAPCRPASTRRPASRSSRPRSSSPQAMPFIVVIVDEMADLMMVAGKEIEACIQRLAQMARASGIHLIMATQRPSVDVITGTIKANFPTRISFQVTSKIDSRTILGEMGAEQLLGQGDMLYMAGGGRITRVHGPFVSDEEVEEVVQPPEDPRHPRLRRRHPRRPRRRARNRDRPRPRPRRQHPVRRRALRPGGGDRRQGPQVLDLLHPAQALGRLQQGRQARRADGGSRASSARPTTSASARCWCRSGRPGRGHRKATPTSPATASSFLSRVQLTIPGTSRQEASSHTSTKPMPRPNSRRPLLRVGHHVKQISSHAGGSQSLLRGPQGLRKPEPSRLREPRHRDSAAGDRDSHGDQGDAGHGAGARTLREHLLDEDDQGEQKHPRHAHDAGSDQHGE